MRSSISRFLVVFVAIAVTTDAAAQTVRDARAIVTIVDLTGAVLPGATVIVTPRQPAGALGVTVTANDAGVAMVPGLKSGHYVNF